MDQRVARPRAREPQAATEASETDTGRTRVGGSSSRAGRGTSESLSFRLERRVQVTPCADDAAPAASTSVSSPTSVPVTRWLPSYNLELCVLESLCL